jgi:chromosome segregation ATPase
MVYIHFTKILTDTMMTNLDPSPQISQDNIGIRERGISSVREYSRVVETFSRVLQYKESFRLSIESKLSSIGKQVKDNIDNLETLMRNINIYKQNIDKISNNLGQLQAEEHSIKSRYEELLNGSTSMEPLLIGEDKNNDDLDSADSREYLIQRRRSYLENLDQNFKRLDGELFSIEKLRSELTRARSEILIKKDEAEKQMQTLEEKGGRHLEDVKRIEIELESSIDEERLLVNEFKRLVNGAERTLEINQEIDHILFTYLTADESKNSSIKSHVYAVE